MARPGPSRLAGLVGLLVLVLVAAGCGGADERDPYREQGPFPTALAPMPSGPAPTAPAVALTEPAGGSGGLRVAVTRTEAVRSVGQGPGELADQPAVAFTVEVRNESDQAISLDRVNVTVSYGPDGLPASPDDNPDAAGLAGTLAAGASATGVYVFRIPDDQRSDVSVVVSYDAAMPALVLTGPVG
ncbi:MAG: hypothetical protein IRZ08_06750 [Frankia sp.]|nr:hypothetical protein [Frankia sp.]